jgi:hypothetical protein
LSSDGPLMPPDVTALNSLLPFGLGPEGMAAAVRTFTAICDRWHLHPEQRARILDLGSEEALDRLLADEKPDVDPPVLLRISYVLGIWKALNTLFSNAQSADTWLSRPNAAPLFGGRPAIEIMASGRLEDLGIVRQYLDAEVSDG